MCVQPSEAVTWTIERSQKRLEWSSRPVGKEDKTMSGLFMYAQVFLDVHVAHSVATDKVT